jgi:hypothetical protein
MKRSLFALAGVLVLLAAPPGGRAARVEADPNKEYVIGPEAGPFAILVKGYTGSDARERANRLALHLRQNGWSAYVYDYTPEAERNAKEWIDARYGNLPPDVPRPHMKIRYDTQWGVFVGGYSDFDSASRDVPRLKKTPEPTEDRRMLDPDLLDPTTKQLYRLNTYAQCMATRNPTMRVQKPSTNATDPQWKELNDGRPYNLLACGKPWTLAVKQFQGGVVVQPRSASTKFLDMIGLGGKSGDVLGASAMQAEEVAKALKSLHYDAYVLHTRNGSIVTVGAFDSKDDKRLLQAAKALRNMSFGQDQNAVRLFAEPLPMPVPQL